MFCLVTDVLDVVHPALDLACACPQRWGCETVIGHHKPTWARASRCCAARSLGASPRKEMWALFAVYQAICQLIGAGIDALGIPPERISFPHALAAATDTIAAFH